MEYLERIESKVNNVLISEIPNPLTLEGVEYLLGLNTFNEVPKILLKVCPVLMECNILSNAETYSKENKEVFVEKGTELIERLINMYKQLLGIEHLKNPNHDLDISINSYIGVLSKKIGKYEEYYIKELNQ